MALFLTETDIRELLTLPELISAMDGALSAFSAGEVIQPMRTVMQAGMGFFGLMPAYVASAPALGAKLVTVYDSNVARGLPSHLATIVMLDPETGVLEAILDGRYITEVRTAAVSAVSVRKLARPDARVLAILGSGVQARSHLKALPLVRSFEEIRAWSPTRAHLETFAQSTGAHAMESAEAAIRGADVIVLATSSATPVLENSWVKPGAHIISIGAYRPTMREMNSELVARARVFVDSRAAALMESGDVVMGIAEGRFSERHIIAELGDPEAARRSPEEITIFKSLGLAVEDIVAARLAFEHAKARGQGLAI